MEFKEIKELLDSLQNEYYTFCEDEDNCPFDDSMTCGSECPHYKIFIRLCNFIEPLHTYVDWEANFDKDYGDFWDKESERIYNILKENNRVEFLLCDECCGCGDW